MKIYNTLIMNIKCKLGFCTVMHCNKKAVADLPIPLGNGKEIKRALCEKHLSQVVYTGSIKSITVEQTYDFENDKD